MPITNPSRSLLPSSEPDPDPPPSDSWARPLALGLLALIAVLLFTIAGRANAAGLLVADGGFGGVLEMKEHTVNVTINNGVAVTEVEQIFLNTENRQVEALYTFPVPKGASVANFSMWINGKEMIGEVLEKQRAREVYESYKRQPTPRDPGLLEQVDYKTFEMRIFPINAGAEQRVRLTYYQQLDSDHDWASYVYPLATTTRQGIDQRVTDRLSLNLRVLSEIPIVEMTSPSHGGDVVIADHSRKFYEASLETSEGDLTRDVVIAYHTSRPRTGIDVITSKPAGEDGYFMLTLTAGEELATLDRAMDYVFVLDISGSMGNDGKLLVSKQSVQAFIDALGPDDRFEVIAFNVQPELAFSGLRDADERGKADAAAFLETQQARGGTVLGPAITTAYKYGDPDRPLNVVILSDGMTEQNERAELLRLIGQGPAHARVFCIGVGNEVNRPLLEQLAEDAGGLAAFLSRGDDFERQAQAFRRKLTRPVATDLRIDVAGVEVYDVEPGVLPNLYHGSPITMFGRYRGGGDARVTIEGDVAGRAISQNASIAMPEADAGNSEIERMWALQRVDRLLKQADRAGSRDGVIDQIVDLGERYSIVTQYTSFIVLENDGEYRRWRIERRNADRIGRDRTKQLALREQLQRMRDRAIADLGPAPSPASVTPGNSAAKQAKAAPRPAVSVNPDPPGNGADFNFDGGGSGGGAGAIDPVTGLLVLGLGGAALMRRKRRGEKDHQRADRGSA